MVHFEVAGEEIVYWLLPEVLLADVLLEVDECSILQVVW